MPLSWAMLGFLWTGSFLYLLSSEKLWGWSEKNHSRLCPWECLIFVQMWPGSFCVSLPSKFECVVSEKAENWTIHGLWPSDIQECCPYWPLFPSDLTNLVPQLDRHWPTFTNLSNFQFWEKEWRKHGTCAGCIESLNSPNKFFGAALFLHTKYSIDRAFEKAEIIPTCRQSYQLSSFLDALEPLLRPQYQLQCVTDGQGRQMLVQIKVSLFSNFSRGCVADPPVGISPYQPCKAQGGIFYAPPNQKDPRHPCPCLQAVLPGKGKGKKKDGMEDANCREVGFAPPYRKGRRPRPWKEEKVPPGAREDLSPSRDAAGRGPALAQKAGPEVELSLPPPSKPSESFHQVRCATVTRVLCEMLLEKQPAYHDCLGNLAAFILEREVADSRETYQLVALGTGDLCYGGWMEFDGRRLHDLHGLVVARRALMRYLYKQLLLCCSQDPAALEEGIFCWVEGGGHLRLKAGCHLHLYLGQMPHGSVRELHTRLLQSNPSADLHVRVKGRLTSVSYCSPTMLSSHVYCASGSDKLTRWSVLGVQGALLSHFLHPVYITSIVLADPYPNCDGLHQIINERVQLGPGDGLPAPYCHKKIYLFEGPPVAPPSSSECASLSLNWCAGDEMLECVNGAVGKAERDIANPGGESRPSRLCKAAMLNSFRKVAQEMKREDLVLLSTYQEAKVQATAYQDAKLQLYTYLSVQGLSKWPQKQLVDSFCR
ncbi:adenosine deaminase domain-containing protein 2-like [Vipera latastei]